MNYLTSRFLESWWQFYFNTQQLFYWYCPSLAIFASTHHYPDWKFWIGFHNCSTDFHIQQFFALTLDFHLHTFWVLSFLSLSHPPSLLRIIDPIFCFGIARFQKLSFAGQSLAFQFTGWAVIFFVRIFWVLASFLQAAWSCSRLH